MKRFLILAGLLLILATSTATAAPMEALPSCTVDKFMIHLPTWPEFQRSQGGPVLFDVWLYYGLDTDDDDVCDSETNNGWDVVDQGHWTVVVPSDTVQSWATGAQAFSHFAQVALDSGVADAYLGYQHMMDLVGGEWNANGYTKQFTYP